MRLSDHTDVSCRISVSNLSYQVGQSVILNNINLESSERRIGIVGRNGSGKSTFARLLCGLIPSSSGTVIVNGVDVANNREKAISTVGMLFQNPDHQVIFPTVEEELVFGLKQCGRSTTEAKQIALEMLRQYDCEHWVDRSVSTLSQGQRHLLCLLSVLLMEPKLIVLDEPYADLDIPTRIQLHRHIANIPASIVHVSHQIEALESYDRVLWLDNGEILMDGLPQETLAAFHNEMKSLGEHGALV